MLASAAGSPSVECPADRTTAVVADSYADAYEATVGMLRADRAGSDELYG